MTWQDGKPYCFRVGESLKQREVLLIKMKKENKMSDENFRQELVEQWIIEDKTFRKELDAIVGKLFDATSLHGRKSRERSLAITKIEEAIMWLGMDLKALGNENPYPNSKNPENTIVDPTADGLKFSGAKEG